MKAKLKGVYLVLDPAEGFEALEQRLLNILKGGIGALQIWDHWRPDQDKPGFLYQLMAVTRGVPLFVNNHLELACLPGIDGVHFDREEDLPDPECTFNKMIGLTVNAPADWGALRKRGVDYISFCAMYPSSSVDTCALVSPDVVREACRHFEGSVFASGGITLENAGEVAGLGVSGIALISALLSAEDPLETTKKFNQIISKP